MKQLTAVIVFESKDWNDPIPFRKTSRYKPFYEQLYVLAQQNGLRICRASHEWFDEERKVFRCGWGFEGGRWIRVYDIVPDIIWDLVPVLSDFRKTGFKKFEPLPILNDPEFTKIANNKEIVADLFPEHTKKANIVHNNQELGAIIGEIPGDMLVIKPIMGSRGAGVKILTKKEAGNATIDQPTIVQEFIDGSQGIPGIVEGIHDLRLTFINEELIYSYIRQPVKGSYLANLAQGGSMFTVELHTLPEILQPAIHAVQKQFRKFPKKIYTIDFMFDENQRPWIIELNTMPGIYFYKNQKKEQDRFFTAITNTLKEVGGCLDNTSPAV